MYKSIIHDGKFLVIVIDGIFESPIMELPTEELADKVAYELQTAWDNGQTWGAYQMRKELDSESVFKETHEAIIKIKSMSYSERDYYHKKTRRRHERVQKVEQLRRWQNVLSWKKHDI